MGYFDLSQDDFGAVQGADRPGNEAFGKPERGLEASAEKSQLVSNCSLPISCKLNAYIKIRYTLQDVQSGWSDARACENLRRA